MSRSYKYPVNKDGGHKYMKHWANKIVRNSFSISGSYFKKIFDSYNICDWRWYPKDVDKIKESRRK